MNILQHHHAVLSMSLEACSFIASINVFDTFEICLDLQDKQCNFAFGTLSNCIHRLLKYLMHFSTSSLKKIFLQLVKAKGTRFSAGRNQDKCWASGTKKCHFDYFLIINSQKNDWSIVLPRVKTRTLSF